MTLAATGLGSVSPAVAGGTIPVPGTSNVLAIPPVTINGASATVQSATYDGLGIYIIAVTVPASADTGSVTVVLGGLGGSQGTPGRKQGRSAQQAPQGHRNSGIRGASRTVERRGQRERRVP